LPIEISKVVDVKDHRSVTEDPAFQYVFRQDDQLFYKTRRMHELDDEVGDLAASIRDLENKLVRDLTEEVLKEEVRR
jgi:DNA mismatch repair ATPase MutS